MRLPDGVYAFTQTIERQGTETAIHPAAVETPSGLVLLDVGYPGLTNQVADNLADAGHDWNDVSAVLLTHQDGDHAGGLAAVLDRTDAIVYAHGACAPYVDGRKHPIKSPEGDRYPPVAVDVEVADGVRFRTEAGPMDLIHTPGHAPGHLSLLFPDAGLLVAADALTADEDGLAGPSEEYTPEMDRALDSAMHLADHDIERVLCYHGGLVEADADAIRTLVRSLR